VRRRSGGGDGNEERCGVRLINPSEESLVKPGAQFE
jgi:hypothetical protein